MKLQVSQTLKSVFRVIEKLVGTARQQILEPKPPEESQDKWPWPPQTAREVHERFVQEDR